MTESTTTAWTPDRGCYFVLQPNETGDTRSHQKGEIYVRKSLIPFPFPDLSERRENQHVSLGLLNVRAAEYGACTFTYWGGRTTPESRLRQFPNAWTELWETDDFLILLPTPNERFFVYFHMKPTDAFPAALELVPRLAGPHSNSGIFELGRQQTNSALTRVRAESVPRQSSLL